MNEIQSFKTVSVGQRVQSNVEENHEDLESNDGSLTDEENGNTLEEGKKLSKSRRPKKRITDPKKQGIVSK